jgi:hypothetical protein
MRVRQRQRQVFGMIRTSAVVAVTVLCVPLSATGLLSTATATSRSNQTVGCSLAASKNVLGASVLRRRLSWQDEIPLTQEIAPTHVYCADLTHDGHADMVVRLVAPRGHPTALWLAFRRDGTRWAPMRFDDPLEPHPYVFREGFGVGTATDTHLYEFVPTGLRLRATRNHVDETVRTYRRHDSQYTPRGPWVTRTWSWNGRRLVRTGGPLLSPYS